MPLRSIVADGLTIGLCRLEPADDDGPEDEADEQRRQNGTAGSECEISEQVERTELICVLGEEIEHGTVRALLPVDRASSGLGGQQPLHDMAHVDREGSLYQHDIPRPDEFADQGRQFACRFGMVPTA